MIRISASTLFVFCLVGCNVSTGSGDSSANNYTCNALSSAVHNVHALVNGNQVALTIGQNYVNEITTSVTICQPGTATCQTIPDVLVDTGSNGLRLFSCAVSLSLTTETKTGGAEVAECVTYADGSSHWGSVKVADVQLGGDKASNVPIQVIDPTYGSVPSSCTNLEYSPSVSGYNGIVGVGLLSNDCVYCETQSDSDTYYSCANGTCSNTTLAAASQVTNPVALMTTDNNGVIITLPDVGTGQSSSSGTLTLGIGTGSTGDNTPGGSVKTFSAYNNPFSLSNDYLDFSTTFNGSTYTAFIDSGSNALYFPSISTLANCTISGFTFYCPSTETAVTATQISSSGAVSEAVTFNITSAQTIFNNGINASETFGGNASDYFDWGLPFFFNRSVYVGISNKASSLGTGPYWAY